MTVLRSLCAYTHDMEPVRAKEECSGARVQAVAWGEPLMPYSVRAWEVEVEVVCARTGIEHHQIGPHTDSHRPVLHQSVTNP